MHVWDFFGLPVVQQGGVIQLKPECECSGNDNSCQWCVQQMQQNKENSVYFDFPAVWNCSPFCWEITPPEDKPVRLTSKSHFGVGFVLNPRRFARNAWFYSSVSLSDLYATYCDCFSAVGGGKLWESVSCCCCNFNSLRYASDCSDSKTLLCICTIVAAWFALWLMISGLLFCYSSLLLCCTSSVGFYCCPAMHDQSHYHQTIESTTTWKTRF